MSNITIGAASISGFNSKDVGADVALTGLVVTVGSATVTGTFRSQWIGMGGFKIRFSTGVTYTVASVESATSLTLTTTYAESSGTVTGTWRKYAVLRVYVLTPFTPSGETYVAQSGAPGSPTWFRRYAVPVISDGTQLVAYTPEIVLPATTNSNVPTARYAASIYGQSGAFLQSYPGCVDQFQLNHLTTPTSWATVCDFNRPAPADPPLQAVNYYTQAQIDARFPSGLAGQLIYFQSTGNVLRPLTPNPAQFSISSDILSISSSSSIVNGPATATDNAIARFDLTTGKLIQNSAVTVADTSGSFAVPDGWSVTNVGGTSVTQNSTAVVLSMPSTSASRDALDINAVSQNQGVGGLGRTVTLRATYNQTSTANSSDLDLVRTETAVGSGQHNFLRAFRNGALRFRVDNLGNLYPGVAGWFIGDENGNEILKFVAGSVSAVNEITLTNAATGVFPSISASGGDSNIDITLTPKGTGKIQIGAPGGTPAAGAISGPAATGTNIAGAALDLAGGSGTGNAAAGQLAARYPLTGASGSAVQSLSANRYPIAANMWTNTSGTVVENTTTETTVFGNASTGSTQTIEGGMARVGQIYRVEIRGVYTTTASPTMRIRIKIGGSNVVDFGAVTLAPASGRFEIVADIHIQVVGATGTAFIQYCYWNFTNGLSGTGAPTHVFSANTATVDFTTSKQIDITAQWSAASASNTFTSSTQQINIVR